VKTIEQLEANLAAAKEALEAAEAAWDAALAARDDAWDAAWAKLSAARKKRVKNGDKNEKA